MKLEIKMLKAFFAIVTDTHQNFYTFFLIQIECLTGKNMPTIKAIIYLDVLFPFLIIV